MNELQIFKKDDFEEIRTLEEDGKILFCASDVAKDLGYSNARDAVKRPCKGVVKRDIGVETGKKADGTTAIQNIEMLFIYEGDVIPYIEHGVKELTEHPDKYKKYESKNRWGTVSSTLLFFQTILQDWERFKSWYPELAPIATFWIY